MGLFNRIRGRSKHSGSKADKLKLWCVRRWLHLLSYDELKEAADYKFHLAVFNEAWSEISKSMIENYYKQTEGNDLRAADPESETKA